MDRIRTKNTLRNHTSSVPVLRRKFTSVPIGLYDSYNTTPVLPDTPATKDEIVPAELQYDRDRIVDESSADHRLKACDHTKIRVDVVKPLQHSDVGYGSVSRQAYPPKKTVAYMWRGVLNSRNPLLQAWDGARSGAIQSLTTLPSSDTAILAALGTPPADRLGELPARLVQAIEEWHLLGSVYESQDYARLMDLAKARGPLRASGTAIADWLKSRNDFSRRFRGSTTRKTLWNLASAYRSGQLGYSFGIMPTVGEVRTISEMLSEGVKPAQTRIIRTIKGQNQAVKNTASSSVNSLYGKFSRKETIELFRVDGAFAELKRPTVRNTSMRNMLNRLVGVSGARLIWDFLPWSFVVDWFLSVDDALDTLWLHSQTEYDIGFWSSTKLSYTREVRAGFLSTEEFFLQGDRIYIEAPPVSATYSHYARNPRPPPSVIDSLRFRMGPKQGFLTILLGLGLVPRFAASKLKAKFV